MDLNHDANSKRPLNSNSSHRLEPGPGPGCIIAPKMRLLLPPSLTFHEQAIRVGDGKNEKKKCIRRTQRANTLEHPH